MMKSAKFWKKLAFLCLIPTFLFANNSADVKLNMDFGRFRYDAASVYLEVYYSVTASHIQSDASQPGSQVPVYLNFGLMKTENDSVLASEQIKVNFRKPTVGQPDSVQAAMGILKLVVPPGKYRVSLSHEADSVHYDVGVSSFEADKITLSDLELCSNIVTNSQNSQNPFYKNTMVVTPHPVMVYGKVLPRLYYYIEMYNLTKGKVKPSDKVVVQAVVADPDGNVRLKKEYHRNHANESTVEKGAFNVRRLETGLYTLIFAVTDSVNKMSVYRRRNFYVQNPDVVLAKAENTVETLANSRFANMPEGQLDLMFEQAGYLATNSEKNVYKVLNSAPSKQQFMFQFWKTRNRQKPGWIDEYYQRVNEADEKYRIGGTKGWQTAMGRVYILYGKPSEFEHHLQERDTNPYEVWYYHDLEGGVEFDFVDFEGMGYYRLVNSTKRGEVNYPNWNEYIYSR